MIPQTGPCPNTVILSAAKDLPRAAHLGETLRQSQGDTRGAFEAKPANLKEVLMIDFNSLTGYG